MCGIAGIYYPNNAGIADHGLVKRMTDVLAHRGPDGAGFHVRGPVGLGHRRLSIIDLEGGTQPLFNEDGTKVIVFNGEIYNFKSLQKTLAEKGHRFATDSDTEAIVHAYEEYGEACVHHLRGMFAFAIWDSEKGQLFLARDRVGIKPLYYSWNGRKFLFASEIKAILQDPECDRALDYRALDDYLTYLYIPAPKTIFRAIRKLPPARTLTVSTRGLHEREYWDLAFAPTNGLSESHYKESLLEKLRESVAIHLMSDVPLGAFLSGGVDSSAVVGIMAGLTDQPVRTASIGFQEAQFDELAFARLVAKRYRTDSYERIVDADAARILDRLAYHFDEPFADSSMVPTYYVSQVARERVTVCLSGDGGDENFAGYRRYRFDMFENRVRAMLPDILRRPVFRTLGRIYPKADWLPRMFRGKALFTNLSLTPERAYFHTMSWFSQSMKSLLYSESLKREMQGYDSFSVMDDHFRHTRGWDPLSRIQYVDIKTYLVDDILTKVDRASMAHSLEVRVPLLDHEFMECAAAIPWHYKLRRGEAKSIFKSILEGILPAEILRRRKMGFSIPLARWFHAELKEVFERQVLSNGAFIDCLFDQKPIRAWWAQHQRGSRDYAPQLWALLVLENWGRKFMG